MKFEEFEALAPQTIYVSATPAPSELDKSGGEVVDQVVRPTGLLDPIIEVRPVATQVDDLLSVRSACARPSTSACWSPLSPSGWRRT